MLACKNGHSEVVRILLSAGVQVNQQDKVNLPSSILAYIPHITTILPNTFILVLICCG